MQGRFIGTCRVSPEVMYGDQEATERELGIRQAAIAAERKRLQPAILRMQRAENARAAVNAREILGEDPVYTAAVKTAAVREVEKADVADIDFEYTPDTASSDDDINPTDLA